MQGEECETSPKPELGDATWIESLRAGDSGARCFRISRRLGDLGQRLVRGAFLVERLLQDSRESFEAKLVREAARRLGDPPALVANTDRLGGLLGWRPQSEGLDEIVRTALAWERQMAGRTLPFVFDQRPERLASAG